MINPGDSEFDCKLCIDITDQWQQQFLFPETWEMQLKNKLLTLTNLKLGCSQVVKAFNTGVY